MRYKTKETNKHTPHRYRQKNGGYHRWRVVGEHEEGEWVGYMVMEGDQEDEALGGGGRADNTEYTWCITQLYT